MMRDYPSLKKINLVITSPSNQSVVCARQISDIYNTLAASGRYRTTHRGDQLLIAKMQIGSV